MDKKALIEQGKAYLGIEFGSTRIKAVLIDDKGDVLSSGGHSWENRFDNGVWTYTMDDVWDGLADCYSDLRQNVKKEYDAEITNLAAIGISAMMHGYLAFDVADNLLVPFRTWRNTITGQAAKELTEELEFNIPERWSIAHLYQAVLNGEEHIAKVDFFTTLAGYVHWQLTGEKVLGVGDASGMFPIDSNTLDYNKTMLEKCNRLIKSKGCGFELSAILPKVLNAGENAGTLTAEGAKRLDVSGNLKAGIMLCPPEGDAGTGMVATNSVAKRTGNISAGTSIFAMVVLEKELKKVYPQIDLVTTPDGAPVGMVHCNNCTSEINAWVNMFAEFQKLMGYKTDMNELFTKMYSVALDADKDCGGLLSYNYVSGESVTGFATGAPLFVHKADDKFTLANVMRMHLYSAFAALKVGLDILFKEEGVEVDEMLGHGGYFKTEKIGQSIAAAAIHAPVSVMETAGEGGAWGIAVLALYAAAGKGMSLGKYLSDNIFAGQKSVRLEPDEADIDGFEKFMEQYRRGLVIEKAAVEAL